MSATSHVVYPFRITHLPNKNKESGKETDIKIKREREDEHLPSYTGPAGDQRERRLAAGCVHTADRSMTAPQCRWAPSSCPKCRLPRWTHKTHRETLNTKSLTLLRSGLENGYTMFLFWLWWCQWEDCHIYFHENNEKTKYDLTYSLYYITLPTKIWFIDRQLRENLNIYS